MVSPSLASEPAAWSCEATLPFSTWSSSTESPTAPLRFFSASAASASLGVMPLRSGTVTVAAGCLPLEKTSLTLVPLEHSASRAGFWLMSLPSSMSSLYSSEVLTVKNPSPYSASLAVASSLVMPSRLGMAWVSVLEPVSANTAPATSAMATITPSTMATTLPLPEPLSSGSGAAWLPWAVEMRVAVVCMGTAAARGMAWVPPATGWRFMAVVGAAEMSEVASPRFTMRPAR